ncbi:hypothetical protein HERIO_2128 [Hepatospora eriocheir]|uniref:Uncharacterized protein n=1 Tax=Hepatospora eriocheir TaxID=1081669 RepID=A0A1X0Q825_9MICR|nr:hypothetical protein HERIO_2128 [Hepatospora eriocheir]
MGKKLKSTRSSQTDEEKEFSSSGMSQFSLPRYYGYNTSNQQDPDLLFSNKNKKYYENPLAASSARRIRQISSEYQVWTMKNNQLRQKTNPSKMIKQKNVPIFKNQYSDDRTIKLEQTNKEIFDRRNNQNNLVNDRVFNNNQKIKLKSLEEFNISIRFAILKYDREFDNLNINLKDYNLTEKEYSVLKILAALKKFFGK